MIIVGFEAHKRVVHPAFNRFRPYYSFETGMYLKKQKKLVLAQFKSNGSLGNWFWADFKKRITLPKFSKSSLARPEMKKSWKTINESTVGVKERDWEAELHK